MKKITTEEFIKRAQLVHGDRYDYSDSVYKSTTTKLTITCMEHGPFPQTPNKHLSGQHCPACANVRRGEKRKDTKESFISKARAIHSTVFEYEDFTYKGSKDKGNITCSKHGTFRQTPSDHLQGKGCPTCGNVSSVVKMTYSSDEYIRRALVTHSKTYTYQKTKYTKSDKHVIVTCAKHGDFSIQARNHLQGQGCPKCATTHSKPHKEIEAFLDSLNVSYISNDRTQLAPKELDIYIPDFALAIEFNGIYWHTEDKKGKDYHQKKTIACTEKGIRLLHIYEDQWTSKRPIVESIIRYAVGKPKKITYARKCEIVEVTSKEARKFYAENHIYEHRGAKYKFGLRDKKTDELLSVMTFGFSRFNKNFDFELIRFANKLNTSIVGGAQRLWKHFRSIHPEASVLCYADASLFTGSLYETLGFTNHGLTPPNHWYLKNGKRAHRMNFTKVKMLQRGEKVDNSLSAHQNALNLGYPCIYDSGSYKLESK